MKRLKRWEKRGGRAIGINCSKRTQPLRALFMMERAIDWFVVTYREPFDFTAPNFDGASVVKKTDQRSRALDKRWIEYRVNCWNRMEMNENYDEVRVLESNENWNNS